MIDAVVRAVPSVGRLVGLGAQQQAVDGTTTATHIEGMEALQQGGGREDDHFEDEHLTESEIRMKEEELTFYSSKHNDHGDDNIWGLLSGVGGNVYEWYDFAVYGLLAPEIGAAFFPQSSRRLQLINSFGVYLAAFLMRPLGAIIFGEMGDRWIGRKHALVFSIVLITVPSVTMGLLPGYDAWGPIAPILLVLLRMIQGLSVGGQLAGSYVLCIEQSSPGQRGFRGSVCDASSVGGFLLASAVTSTVRYGMTHDEVRAWGWRLPFWFSLLLAPLLVYIVGHTEESKFWEEGQQRNTTNTKEKGDSHKDTENVVPEEKGKECETARPALLDLLDSPFRRRQLAGMIGVLSATTSSFYILFLWVPVYLSELRGFMSQADADLMNFIVLGCYIFFLLGAGKLSDMFPHRTDLMKIGLPGIIVGCPTMFGMFECQSWWGYLFGQLQFGVCLALIGGCVASWNVELWMADPTLSYTGVAIGHNTAATIFGGTMPLIATSLYYCSLHFANEDDEDNDEDTILSSLLPRLIPGFYVSFLGILSFLCITFVIRHPHDVRTGGIQLADAVGRHNSWKYKSSNGQAGKRTAFHTERRDAGISQIGYIPPSTLP